MAGQRLFPVEVQGLENHAQARRQVIFHGINKSGSLAMTEVLMKAYYRANRANQFMTTYKQVPGDLDQLRKIIGSSTGHSFFMAHYLYGSYRSRPGRQTLVTQFRNPLTRARSCHQWLQDRHGVDLTFEQWLTESRGLKHTQMQQFAIGFGAGRPGWDSMDGQEMFERAVHNIERDVAWFGLSERFEESIFAMAAMCGLKKVPAWQRDNRSPNRPLATDWAPGEFELAQEILTWDMRLYEWAVAKFEANLSNLSFGEGLDDYRVACRGEYKDRLDPTGNVVQADLAVPRVPISSSSEEPLALPGSRRLGVGLLRRRR